MRMQKTTNIQLPGEGLRFWKISTLDDTSMRNKWDFGQLKIKRFFPTKIQAMTFDREYKAASRRFSSPTADLDANVIVELNIESSLVNSSRRNVAVDREMKNVPFHETQGFTPFRGPSNSPFHLLVTLDSKSLLEFSLKLNQISLFTFRFRHAFAHTAHCLGFISQILE